MTELTPLAMKQLITIILVVGSIIVTILGKGEYGSGFLIAALLVWIFG